MQNDFTPAGETLLWRTDLLILHVGSDTLIALSFLSISAAIITLLRRRPDDTGLFLGLMATFTFLVALTHVAAILITWYPAYYFEGTLKLVTGVIAAAAAVIAWQPLPQIVSTPSRTTMANSNKEVEALNKQLQNSVDSLGIMAGGVSHELNNLLTIIKGNSQLLARRLEDDEERQGVSAIEEAADRAEEVCRQLLAISGRGHFLFEQTDLNEIVETTKLPQDRSINLNFSLTANLKPINASRNQIAQLFIDLYTNAMTAIQASATDRGEITISTYEAEISPGEIDQSAFVTSMRPGQAIMLEIRDNGSGMSKQVTDRVFEPYYSTRFMGRGLGLAAVQGIVNGHQGALFIDSKPNAGTIIRVAFPFEPVASIPYRAPNYQQPRCILVVDDRSEVLALAEAYLAELGIRTYSTTNPSEALRIAIRRKGEIEAVILDYLMPFTTGSDLLRAITEHLPEIDAYLTSGYSRGEIDDPSLRKLLTGFIAKPFVFEDFRRRFDHPPPGNP